MNYVNWDGFLWICGQMTTIMGIYRVVHSGYGPPKHVFEAFEGVTICHICYVYMPILEMKMMSFDDFLADFDKSIVKILLEHTEKHFKTLTLGIQAVVQVENVEIHFFLKKN